MAERMEITLAQIALVRAAVGDGLTLAAAIAHAGVPALAYTRASLALDQRVLADLDAGGTLAEELGRAIDDAQKTWERKLPPLDEELDAWLDFDRAWAEEVDADAWLAERGMRPADVRRLQNLWAERFEADRELATRAVLRLADVAGPPPIPRPEPPSIGRRSERP
jgi:hypothetical protein